MDHKSIVSSCEIGAALKRRRKELSWSQEKLANMLQVSYQQVQRYENGTDRLNVVNIQEIACVLKVPVCYFFCPDVAKQEDLTCECDELLTHCKKIHSKEIKEMLIKIAMAAAKE